MRHRPAHQGGDALGPQGRQGQQEYLTFKFRDVVISSFQTGGSEETPVPTDSVSFSFAKVEVEYKPEKSDGSLGSPLDFRYDLKTNKTF